MTKSEWAKALREYLTETPEESDKKAIKRLSEQWDQLLGKRVTYNPLILVGFEEAMAKAEGERSLPQPVTALVANGNQHDFHWMDRGYVIGCDPYKEGGEGSFTIFQEPSVLTQEQFDEEVQRLAGFFGKKIS